MTFNGNLSQKALYKVRIWTTLSRHLPNSGNQDQSLIYRSLWSFRWTYDWLKNRSASKNVRRSQIYRINRFWQSNFAFWNEKLSEASSTFLIERMQRRTGNRAGVGSLSAFQELFIVGNSNLSIWVTKFNMYVAKNEHKRKFLALKKLEIIIYLFN